jgi:hypothetical protein
MNNIKKFNDFSSTLHAFDFDNTLAKTPKFEDIAKAFLEENTVKGLLNKSIDKLNEVDVSMLNYENGRIYISDPSREIKTTGNWIRKGNRIYLTTPNGFDYIEESMPSELKNTADIYKSVENKCIITARPEGSRQLLDKTLQKLGIEYPNYGLYMRPDGLNNAGRWKGFQICELAKKYNFSSIVFYDDNPKYIKGVKEFVSNNLPSLNLKVIKVR